VALASVAELMLACCKRCVCRVNQWAVHASSHIPLSTMLQLCFHSDSSGACVTKGNTITAAA